MSDLNDTFALHPLPLFRAALLSLIFLMPAGVGAEQHAGNGLEAEKEFAICRQELYSAEWIAQKGYALDFNGNRALRDSKLRAAAADELESFAKSGHRFADINDAAFQMELAYRAQGYAFARVDYRCGLEKEGLLVSFLVSEGPQVLIESINLNGNTAFADEELAGFFSEEQQWYEDKKNIYVEAKVNDGVNTISDLYYETGYLDASVQGPHFEFSSDNSRVTISLDISEGYQFVINSVDFDGDVLEEAEEGLSSVAQTYIQQVYFKRRKIDLQSRITEIYSNLGYPSVKVVIDDQETVEPGKINLTAEIISGPMIRIKKIIIKGNAGTRESFIRNRIAFKEGELYTFEKQRKSFLALFRTGLFSKIDITIAPGSTEERDLFVQLEELLPREFSFEVGWGSYELFRVKSSIVEKNLLGTGRTARAQAGASTKGENVVIGITDPWFLQTDITVDLPFSYSRREQPSFEETKYGVSVFFSKTFRRDLATTLGYLISRTDITDVEEGFTLENQEDQYNLASIKLQLIKDKRNDIFFPTKGYRFSIAEEIADSILGSEEKFSRFTSGISIFFPIATRTVFGFRYNTGFIIPTDNQVTIPAPERFYNGGENTVRSYSQDLLGPVASGRPVGGNAFNVINLELRYRFSKTLAATIFFDTGNIAPNRSREELKKPPYDNQQDVIDDTFNDYFRDFRSAVGFGIQYLLPVGPARLDVGFNPNREKISINENGDVEGRGEDDLAIHFSVGMAF